MCDKIEYSRHFVCLLAEIIDKIIQQRENLETVIMKEIYKLKEYDRDLAQLRFILTSDLLEMKRTGHDNRILNDLWRKYL